MNREKPNNDRRSFIRNAALSTIGLAAAAVLPGQASENFRKTFTTVKSPKIEPKSAISPSNRINFSVIGINHSHIYSQVAMVIEGGGRLVSFFAKEPELIAAFTKRYPQAVLARSEEEILEDESIHLIVSAAIPNERAKLGIRAMLHGKDFMVDKPGITSLKQLSEVRKVQKRSGRIYSINTERFENPSIVKAGELVKAGAIGDVVQTIGLGPHRMSPKTRPDWFFDAKKTGGIICDIGSHQFDQYLYFTGTTAPTVVAAHAGNINNQIYPGFQDYGDVTLRGDGGMGYIRVDWFSPDGLKTWGDGRLTILGTDGYIELRKTIDIEGREGKNHLFLVNQKERNYFDCSQVPLTYGTQLVDDILNRTETVMSQAYCFMVAELGLTAQKRAKIISNSGSS
jgi:predicted dehydrogenase